MMMNDFQQIRDALETLIRCGQSQGFNDGYEAQMMKANKALATLDRIIKGMQPSADTFDYQRVKEWALSNPRKPAVLSFTEGADRDVAYLIEELKPSASNQAPLASISGNQAALDVDAIQSIVDQYFEEVLKNKSYSGRTSRGATWARANDQLNAIRADLTAKQPDVNRELLEALKEGAIAKAAYLGDDYDPKECQIQKAIANAEQKGQHHE